MVRKNKFSKIVDLTSKYINIHPPSNMEKSIQESGGVPSLALGTLPASKTAPDGTEGSGSQMHVENKKLKSENGFYGSSVGTPRTN